MNEEGENPENAPFLSTGSESGRGRGAGWDILSNIFTNFIKYGLRKPEVVVCNISAPPWQRSGWLDALISDPPYVASTRPKTRHPQGKDGIPEDMFMDTVSQVPQEFKWRGARAMWSGDQMAIDLLQFAAQMLRDDGRLAYFLPLDLANLLGVDRQAVDLKAKGAKAANTAKAKAGKAGKAMEQGDKHPGLWITEDTADPLLLNETRYMPFLPTHPDLELLGASLQVLSHRGVGRLLVTMKRRKRLS